MSIGGFIFFLAGKINHNSNISQSENPPTEQIEFRDVANYRHKSNLHPYGRYLFSNPNRGTVLEAIRIDVVSQRKHMQQVLDNIIEVEKALGCYDEEIGLEVHTITEQDVTKARGIVIWLERQHIRASHYHGHGPWKEYFKNRRIGLSDGQN